MNPTIARTHPSDLFHAAIQATSADVMAEALSCGKTHVYKQAAHPDKQGEARTSFIEKAERFFTALMKKNPRLAQTIADRFCRICGGKFVPVGRPRADKETLLEELLDNVPAFADYTEAWNDKSKTIEERSEKLRVLIDELEQDFDERLK